VPLFTHAELDSLVPIPRCGVDTVACVISKLVAIHASNGYADEIITSLARV
jgi:hypothetical protein